MFTSHPDQTYITKNTKSIALKLNIVAIPLIYSILASQLFLSSYNSLLQENFKANTDLVILIFQILYILCLIVCAFASYGAIITVFSTVVLAVGGYYLGMGGYKMSGTIVS